MDDSVPAVGRLAVFGGIASLLFGVLCLYQAWEVYSRWSRLFGVVTFLLGVAILVGGVLRVRTAMRARSTPKPVEVSSPPS